MTTYDKIKRKRAAVDLVPCDEKSKRTMVATAFLLFGMFFTMYPGVSSISTMAKNIIQSSKSLFTLDKEILVKARTEIANSIKGIQDGQTELKQVYPQLKTQLIDPLGQQVNQVKVQSTEVSDALSPLKSIPSFLKSVMLHVAMIDDIEPTLAWVVDVPMAKLSAFMQKLKQDFENVGKKFDPQSAEGKKLYDAFEQSAQQLTSATRKVDRIIAAMK